MTCLAGFAVHKWVGEAAEVTRSDPSLRIHKYSGVKSYVVRTFLNEFFPPCFFDVVFEFNTERTVVPSVCKTAVNFGAGVNKSSALTERNDLVH